jgi:hypothetical protein
MIPPMLCPRTRVENTSVHCTNSVARTPSRCWPGRLHGHTDDGQAVQANEAVDQARLFVRADWRRADDQDVVSASLELVVDGGEQVGLSDDAVDCRHAVERDESELRIAGDGECANLGHETIERTVMVDGDQVALHIAPLRFSPANGPCAHAARAGGATAGASDMTATTSSSVGAWARSARLRCALEIARTAAIAAHKATTVTTVGNTTLMAVLHFRIGS